VHDPPCSIDKQPASHKAHHLEE